MKNKNFTPKLISLIKDGISKKQVTKDILSGLIVGIIALPLAIAFAIASGVSPKKGLVTAIVAGLVVSILSGSRVQIGGPTRAFIIIVYGIVQDHGVGGFGHCNIFSRISNHWYGIGSSRQLFKVYSLSFNYRIY